MNIDLHTIWDGLCVHVDKRRQKLQIPGAALGIIHNNEMFTTAFGVTNINHPIAVDESTLFQIGSITKTYTGTAMMRLVEQGKIDLDAPVRSYIPDFKVQNEEVSSAATISHLLTHMGGWVGDLFKNTGAGDDALARYVAAMADLEQLAPLDTQWSYNNSGFSAAGYVMEQVLEKPYEQIMQELIFDPLGLEQTYLTPVDVMTHRFVSGHKVGDSGPVVARPWPLFRSAHPAGGVISSITDLLRYAQFQLGDGTTGDGTPILESESLAHMQSPLVHLYGDKEYWGLTWAVENMNGVRIVSHGGGTVGQISRLALIPAHNFALAILTNADKGGKLAEEALNFVLKELFDLEKQRPKPLDASKDELQPFVGRYSRPFADVDIGLLAGQLVAKVTAKQGFPDNDVVPPSPPPFSLALSAPNRLIATDGEMKDATIDVLYREDGSIGWLRFGRLYVRQDH